MRNLNFTNMCIPFNNVLFFLENSLVIFLDILPFFAISHNEYISLIEKE